MPRQAPHGGALADSFGGTRAEPTEGISQVSTLRAEKLCWHFN